MPFYIQRNDITKMQVDAIVNAANSKLQQGSGVCGAIFRAAGAQQLQAECDAIGNVATGEAVITKGYNLFAQYIIHTAGPVWDENPDREKLLYSSYYNSLMLAKEHNVTSIAFPLISSGVYGCPKVIAVDTAKRAILDFLQSSNMTVYLVVFDKASFSISSERYKDVQSYIDDKYVDINLLRRRKRDRRESIKAEHEKRPVFPTAHMDMCEEVSLAKPSASMPKRKIDELIKNLDETFSEMLLRLIDEKGMTDVETYKRANIDRKLFSKIRSNKDYKPSKPTAVAFAIALRLSYDETVDLLRRAGLALSRSNKFDVIIEYFIKNSIYDIFEVNDVLFEFDQILLGR